MEDSFSTDQGWGWFWDDSSALHLSCTLFLLLLHQLHLRSSGTGSQRWGPLASVQFSHSVMSNSVTPWTAARQASLSITNSWSLLRLMSIESVMPSNHLIHCHPLLLPHSVFPRIRVFSNESTLCIRWPKFWSFSISPSNEYSGLTSFRMDWLDLLAVQETLKSLLQHQSSKASIIWCSVFFMGQLSHPYMTTIKTRQTFFSKVMSLLFNMLSMFITVFLPRSKCPNFMAAVTICSDFGAQENSLSLFPLFPHLLAMK